MTAPEVQLEHIVGAATPRLEAISDADASRPRSEGKWSRKEIVGHLIDSASNNHGRFVRAQFSDDLVCPTYDQDAWVRVQNYIRAPWVELVTLWSLYNLHLTRVIAAIPPGPALAAGFATTCTRWRFKRFPRAGRRRSSTSFRTTLRTSNIIWRRSSR